MTNQNIAKSVSEPEPRSEEWRALGLQKTLTCLHIYTEATDDDFDLWSKKPCWTIEEAAALCIGRNPTFFQYDTMKAYEFYDDSCKQFLTVKDIISRAISIGSIDNPIIPISFINWAEPNYIEGIPARLSKGVKEFHKSLSQPNGDEISLRLKENLLLTIYLLAVKHLDCDAPNKRNQTQITDIISSYHDAVNSPLKPGTIRNYIIDGREIAKRERLKMHELVPSMSIE